MRRVNQIDFFRGLFLIVMTANHLMSSNNIIVRFSYEFVGWITAAEGFILLAGFTAGLVFSSVFLKKGIDKLTKLAQKRSATLYVYHIAITLLVLLCIYNVDLIQDYWKTEVPELFPGSALAFSLVPALIFQPAYLDILPMYVLLFLLVPVAIKAFFFGQHLKVIIGSLAVYVLGFLFFNRIAGFNDFKNQFMPSALNPFCWQLLFFAGLYCGYLFQQGKLKGVAHRTWLFAFFLFISVLFFVVKSLKLGEGPVLDYWTSKINLGPLRLVNIAALTYCMAYLASKQRRVFSFKPVCYLGKHSLEVFCFHALLVYVFRPLIVPLNNAYVISIHSTYKIFPLETIFVAALVISLFFAPTMFLKRKLSWYDIRNLLSHLKFLK